MNALGRVFGFLAVPLAILYPLAIGFGEGRIQPRFLAAALLIAGLARFPALSMRRIAPWWFGALLALGLLAVAFNVALPLKFYPVLVNAALLTIFASSLLSPPTVIERLARLKEPNLSPQACDYVRHVTQVWCVFFALNGTVALITALWASARVWMLYNGFVSYILMGLLFTGEFLVRRRFKRRYDA